MKVAILGTGIVGRVHAVKLVGLGYEVVMGTNNVTNTKARSQIDEMGNPPFSEWLSENGSVKLVPFADAAEAGEIIINALAGHASVSVLTSLKELIGNKILIDITNSLDFSKGMPPILSVVNSDSLGEQNQRALPEAKVVKTFNMLNSQIQVNPDLLAGGDHHLFISGNDEQSKSIVIGILTQYGWQHIIDLGDITTARGTEMYLPLWLRLWGSLGHPMFNIKLVTGE